MPMGAPELCDPILADGTNLFMSCPDGIERMPVGGGDAAVVQTPHSVSHTIPWFTIDADTLYFSEFDTTQIHTPETLYAVPLDGSADPVIVSTERGPNR